MDFRFTDEQQELIAGVRDFLAGIHGPETLRRLDASESRRSTEISAGITAMGLQGFLVPEAQGGLGRSLAEGAAIALECGRAALAEPFVDTALVAAPLLVRAGGQEALLADIAAGDARLCLQHPSNPWVADAEGATLILFASEGLALGAVAAAEPIESVDPLRRLYRVEIAGGEGVVGSADDLLDHAALMSAAQALGAAEAMLAIAAEYAKTRHQFGQPIGAFQAVKHHLASVAVAIEFARPVLWRATDALAQSSPHAAALVSHACISARAAARGSAETAIQVHGAMGYTYEVDLHFWMKRVWALCGAWGDHAFHQRRIDEAVLGGTLPVGPSSTFA